MTCPHCRSTAVERVKIERVWMHRCEDCGKKWYDDNKGTRPQEWPR